MVVYEREAESEAQTLKRKKQCLTIVRDTYTAFHDGPRLLQVQHQGAVALVIMKRSQGFDDLNNNKNNTNNQRYFLRKVLPKTEPCHSVVHLFLAPT